MQQTRPTTRRQCWCGHQALVPFSSTYGLCQACGTLVSQGGLANDGYVVRDDESDFYGKQYWLDHMDGKLGLPRIQERARLDLPERCCYWLRQLLSYRLPPARVLELGAAHGGFVSLMRWAGYDATGLEMSPWVADLARQTFQVPMLVGPVEHQGLAPSSFDVLVANDVVEHLPDPLTTLGAAVQLLKPEGILVIQMPEFVEGMSYAQRLAAKERFLEHTAIPDEHLYLHSRRSTRLLLNRLGLVHVEFCQALFDYDMYFVASRVPLIQLPPEEVAITLQASPLGRLVLALLDKGQEFERLRKLWQESETDRAARLESIKELNLDLEAINEDRTAQARMLQQQDQMLREQQATIRDMQEALVYLQSTYLDGRLLNWDRLPKKLAKLLLPEPMLRLVRNPVGEGATAVACGQEGPSSDRQPPH